MPIDTYTISATNQDGSTRLQDAASNPANVNNTNSVMSPFFGPSGNNPHCAYFCFPITNTPRFTVLNSVTIAIRNQSSAYTNGSSSRIYIAVENNLFTDPVAGSGMITRSTKGKVPWDRLGRITEAVGFYGNRCGPTHSHPSGLAGYGASVRDPYALLTKAYCSDQGTANAPGVSIAAPSKIQSENFAAALQPLVDDPGWDPVLQWVMVYVFSDSTVAGSTVTGVGNLEGLTYHNGMVPSNLTTSGQGQATMFSSGAPDTYPVLTIDYQSTSLNSETVGSKSFGKVSFEGTTTPIGIWRGVRMENENRKVVIGNGGVGDLPASDYNPSANPNSNAWGDGSGPAGTYVRLLDTRPEHHPEGYGLEFGDIPGNTITATWNAETYKPGRGPMHTYSLRFYHALDYAGDNPFLADYTKNIIRFTTGGATQTRVFEVNHGPKFWETGKESQAIIAWSGGNSGYSTNPIPGRTNKAQYNRYEIQVSEYATPKVRVRIYAGNSTTPLAVLTANPPSVTADRFILGDLDNSGLTWNWKLADFEAYDDYYLNGVYAEDATDADAHPYFSPVWQFFETTEEDAAILDEVGVVTSIDPDGSNAILDLFDPLNQAELINWISPGDKTWTKYENLTYGSGLRRVDLYVPDGTPPEGGWPVLLFAHGGFFIGGNKNVVSPMFVNNVVPMGVAVASVQYVLNGYYAQALGQTYPAYNPSVEASARYPTPILNFKEAAHYLKSVAGTYGLNPDRFIASGVSAGGYIAMAAAASRGLTNDGGGRNLTLAGNSGTLFTPNVADPEFHAVYAWCPPINFEALRASDKTNNARWWIELVPFETPRVGAFWATSRLFMGRLIDSGSFDTSFTGVDSILKTNAANVPLHWAVCRAGWDWLVPYNADGFIPPEHDHHHIFTAALDEAAPSLPPGFEFTDHLIYDAGHATVTLQDMDYSLFRDWLRKVLA